MLKKWLANRRLERFTTRTGVSVQRWEQMLQLANLKQIIVPSVLGFYTGEPSVRQYFAVADQTLATKQWVLQVAASLARSHKKGVLGAVVRAAHEADLPLREIDSDEVGEDGIIGKLDRTWYVLGDTSIMALENIELGVTIQTLAHQFELDGKYTLFLAQKQPKRLLGIFACEYNLRPDAVEAVRELQGAGITLVLLTSSKTSLAKGLGNQLNLSLIHSELVGPEKERVLRSLVLQQPATAVLGPTGGLSVPHILLPGERLPKGQELLVQVPDLPTIATVVQEARTLVKEQS